MGNAAATKALTLSKLPAGGATSRPVTAGCVWVPPNVGAVCGRLQNHLLQTVGIANTSINNSDQVPKGGSLSARQGRHEFAPFKRFRKLGRGPGSVLRPPPKKLGFTLNLGAAALPGTYAGRVSIRVRTDLRFSDVYAPTA
jgi:hypothetical protein